MRAQCILTLASTGVSMRMRVEVAALGVHMPDSNQRADGDICSERELRTMKGLRHLPACVSTIYRPRSVCWNSEVMKPSPSPELVRMRKWIQNAFQKKEALEAYQDAQKREVNVFLNNILSTPDAWAAHCTRCVL